MRPVVSSKPRPETTPRRMRGSWSAQRPAESSRPAGPFLASAAGSGGAFNGRLGAPAAVALACLLLTLYPPHCAEAQNVMGFKRPYRVFYCPMRGRLKDGTVYGEENSSGFMLLSVFKRSDGDYNVKFKAGARLATPGVPTSTTVSIGEPGTDGIVNIDFAGDAKWRNASSVKDLLLKRLFPLTAPKAGYTYLATGEWQQVGTIAASIEGSSKTLRDVVDGMRKNPYAYHATITNEDYPIGVARGQCGLNRGPFG
eukprot:TRINITY_DN29041_c0_g1_i1.p1 TRINITY_DN29041_c0_g1~~TRINITY_DN29041_c0_g1_i1.p1  ORF type:complete len:255 (+),score=-20.94 TRINITY_DN29041_c0_g1_i1:210-974(+)